MYKFEMNPNLKETPLRMRDTKVGDLMVITHPDSPYIGNIVLHTYDGFVNLREASCTWKNGALLSVQLLPKGTVITLTVE